MKYLVTILVSLSFLASSVSAESPAYIESCESFENTPIDSFPELNTNSCRVNFSNGESIQHDQVPCEFVPGCPNEA